MKVQSTNDYYAILGISPDASQSEIKAAYRKRAAEVHPDKGGSQQAMADLNEAYDCLSDTPRRLLYDQTGQDSCQQLEQEVRTLLMNEFATALNADATDILRAVRASLEQKLEGVQGQRTETEVARRKFETRRNRIKTKDGAGNLFHLVIDKQLKVIEAGFILLDRQEKLLTTALSSLDSYESEEVIPKYTLSDEVTYTFFGRNNSTSGFGS